VVALLAAAESLGKRIERRNPKARDEIVTLLQGVIDAVCTTSGADEAAKITAARGLLQQAEVIYYREAQTKNRLYYVSGLGIGVCAVVLVPPLLLWIVRGVALWLSDNPILQSMVDAVPLGTIAPLLFFAGLGASASVLSRLTALDLREETSKQMILITAAARPALSVIFASVIFLVLNYNLVNVGIGSGSEESATKLALTWIAAFLCGYSERIASDILDRVPFIAGRNGVRTSLSGSSATPSGAAVPHAGN
jgi:hypothetical protein